MQTDGQDAGLETGEEFVPGQELGEPEVIGGEQEASEETEQTNFIRDLSEEETYKTLLRARNLEDKFTDQFGGVQSKLQALEEALQKMQSPPSEPSVDVDKIKQVLEKYDPGLASSGLAEALAESIKFTPLSEEHFSKVLEPLQQQIGGVPIGNQIVLSHYDVEDVKAMVPPTDQQGNMIPQTQRHKDFLEWYEVQPHNVQQGLTSFGPSYVQALKKFEKWENEKNGMRSKAVEDKTSRLAGGVPPSANNRRGSNNSKTPEELFLEGFNEVD